MNLSRTIPTAIFTILLLISCNTKNKIINTNITFKEDVHDFKEIPPRKEVNAKFHFENTGKVPLVIKEV
jgi:hypothetical protein